MAVLGYAQGASIEPLGSELVADVPAGSLVLPVEWTGQFDDGDGALELNGTQYTYSAGAIDEEAATITLDFVTAEDATVGDAVSAVSGGEVVSDLVLHVSCGDGDPIEVVVKFRDRDLWPEGEYDDPVQVLLSDDLETIIDVPGRTPKRDAALIDPDTILDNPGLQEIFDAADAAAAAAAEAALNGTAALTAANGKNKVTYSSVGPGSTPNTAGDIWWQRSGGLIFGQWEGMGGTTWQGRTLAGAVIAYLDAGQLTAGSAFTNALSVKTNFTLGDASTNGVIQSHNFAGSSVGVYIDKFGLVAKGGTLAATAIIGATITGSSFATNTGYDDITITPGDAFTPAAIKFLSDGPGIDNSVPASLSMKDGTWSIGGVPTYYVTASFQGGKYTHSARPRIDIMTQRYQSDGNQVRADINYHAGGPLGGQHYWWLDGNNVMGLYEDGLVVSGGRGIGIGQFPPVNGLFATGLIKSSARMECDTGFYDLGLFTGGFTGASINDSGKIVRTPSSSRFKQAEEPLTLAEARVALDLEAVTFQWRPEMNMGSRRIPGFIAEQAHDAGAGLWVTYEGDDEAGAPAGVRYPELTAAHNVLLRDHEQRAVDQAQRITELEATVEALQATVQQLLASIEGA